MPRPTKKQNLVSLSLWLVFDSGSCVRVPVSKWISPVHTCVFGHPSPRSPFRIHHRGQVHIRGGKNGISSTVRHEPSLFLQQHKMVDSPKSTNNFLRGVTHAFASLPDTDIVFPSKPFTLLLLPSYSSSVGSCMLLLLIRYLADSVPSHAE